MHDEVRAADGRSDESDGGREFGDFVQGEPESDGILDLATDAHDFEERVVNEGFELAADDVVEIPEPVVLHEGSVVTGEREVRVMLEEQVAEVGQVDEAVELGIAEAVLLAEFVGKQGSRLGQVVDQVGLLRTEVAVVMVEDEPVAPVEARFEGEVRDPRHAFGHRAQLPALVMERFEGYVRAEEMLCEALQEHPGNQTVQVALVRADHLRCRQSHAEESPEGGAVANGIHFGASGWSGLDPDGLHANHGVYFESPRRWTSNQSAKVPRSFSMFAQPWSAPGFTSTRTVAPTASAFFL